MLAGVLVQHILCGWPSRVEQSTSSRSWSRHVFV